MSKLYKNGWPAGWCDPLRDAQAAPPTGYCPRCGGELYGDEEGNCRLCRDQEERGETKSA